MITDNDLTFTYSGEDGVPICFVIGEDNLYDLAISKDMARMFLSSASIQDVSSYYPELGGITVRFLNETWETIEDLNTSEYFGSILLSSPKMVNYLCHAYGLYAESLESKFIDYDFVIYNRPDLSPYSRKWHSEKYTPQQEFIKCSDTEGLCGCGWQNEQK